MTLFAAWSNLNDNDGNFNEMYRDEQRRKIAAGAALFNSAPVQISNVRGLNDNAALGKPSTFTGSCTTCHDTPNVGNHSFPLPLDIGTGHSVLPGAEPDPNIAAGLAELSMPDLPVYLINGCPNPFNPGQAGIVLHDRSGQGAHFRAVQRLQPRQRPDSARTRGPRPVFP